MLCIFLFSTTTSVFAESEIVIPPTDDAYVVTDLSDSQDTQGFNKINTGNAEFLKVWYGWNITEHNNQIFSPAFLKFDLPDIQDKEIQSAKLKFYVEEGVLIHEGRALSAFLVDSFDWNESQITFDTAPEFDDLFVTTQLLSPGWHEFDLTPLVLENTSDKLSIAILFPNMESNTEELIIISSKESQNPDQRPSLVIITQEKTISDDVLLYPNDDAFVITDLNDPLNTQLLQSLNTGELNFLKIWYANDVTPNHEMITSNGYLKFDFSEIDKNKIEQVTLNLKPLNLVKNSDSLSLILGQASADWDEDNVTFTTKPDFSSNTASSYEIYEDDVWVSLDVTEIVKESTDSELTFVLGLDDVSENSEELVEFYSKESSENTPFIRIQYIPNDTESNGGGCLIATAAYGTELAPQVQFLREIRDSTVMSTASGASFMTGFNQIYYSFSPTIADWERENPMFREAVRAFITPMISTLSIMTLSEDGSEVQVIGLGLSIIALNIGIYFITPVIGIKSLQKIPSKKGIVNKI